MWLKNKEWAKDISPSISAKDRIESYGWQPLFFGLSIQFKNAFLALKFQKTMLPNDQGYHDLMISNVKTIITFKKLTFIKQIRIVTTAEE